MPRLCAALLVSAILSAGLAGSARADDQEVKAILDKAIKALGGEEKLKKAEAYSEKHKGTLTFGGNDSEFTTERTVQGVDRVRAEFESEFNGNKFKFLMVLDGDKAWGRFGDATMPLDETGLAREKQNLYLAAAPVTLLPLKGKGFQLEAAGEEKIADKPALVIKGTGPDGKEFSLAFDKDSGLPVRLVAKKVLGFQGDEFTLEVSFADYKEFGGLKRATRTQQKRDGETFLKQELTEFKPLEKVDAKTFAEPQ